MESNTSYNCSMQTVSHLQNWFVWLVNNASRNLCLIILFVLYISCLGIRQEQDLYVRLIDSATKQVLLAHRSLNIHKPLQKYQLYSRLNLTSIVLVRFQIRGKKLSLLICYAWQFWWAVKMCVGGNRQSSTRWDTWQQFHKQFDWVTHQTNWTCQEIWQKYE